MVLSGTEGVDGGIDGRFGRVVEERLGGGEPGNIQVATIGERRVRLVSLNRLSVGCVTTPKTQSGNICRLLNNSRMGLNNATTSRIVVNPAVIPIL